MGVGGGRRPHLPPREIHLPQCPAARFPPYPALAPRPSPRPPPRGTAAVPPRAGSSPSPSAMAAAKPPPEHLFNPTTESDPLGGLSTKLPAMLPPGPARRWLEERRAGVRPWGSFLDQRRFGVPHNAGELCQRLSHNAEHFQSNYLCVFLGLILYCLITSPLLLVALGVFFGACYVVRLRAQQAPLVLLGRELTPPHQYALAGGVSLPVFWLAGAGAAVFWVLGATLVVIGSHAALRHPDPPETPELQMEPV